MELRLPLERSPGREAACRAVFGTWGFSRTMHGKTAHQYLFIHPSPTPAPEWLKDKDQISLTFGSLVPTCMPSPAQPLKTHQFSGTLACTPMAHSHGGNLLQRFPFEKPEPASLKTFEESPRLSSQMHTHLWPLTRGNGPGLTLQGLNKPRLAL